MLQLDPRLAAYLARRYTIDREIGRGGMAIVYLAADTRHTPLVAIKVLNKQVEAGRWTGRAACLR